MTFRNVTCSDLDTRGQINCSMALQLASHYVTRVTRVRTPHTSHLCGLYLCGCMQCQQITFFESVIIMHRNNSSEMLCASVLVKCFARVSSEVLCASVLVKCFVRVF
jgi:hypothetical protein